MKNKECFTTDVDLIKKINHTSIIKLSKEHQKSSIEVYSPWYMYIEMADKVVCIDYSDQDFKIRQWDNNGESIIPQ
jgi:hypothetical protein